MCFCLFYSSETEKFPVCSHAAVLLFLICHAGRISSSAVVHAEYACTWYLFQ